MHNKALTFEKVTNFGYVAYQLIGVGAGKFLGVRRYFAQISPNLPEKISNKMTAKRKRLHFISCCAHLFKAKHFKHCFS